MRVKIVSKNINELDRSDIEDINYVLKNSEYATIFHTIEWNKIISDVENKRCYFLIAKKNNRPVGVFPFYIMPKFLIFKISTSSSLETRYGGPIAVDNDSDIIKQLIRKYESGGRGLIWYIKTPPRWDAKLLADVGYRCETEYNSILDLNRDIEILCKKLNKKTRNCVRKAEKSGVKIDHSYIQDLDVFYNMIKSAYDHSEATYIPPKILYEKIFEKLDSILFLARYEDRYVACALFLTFKDVVTFIAGASYRENLNTHPNNGLFWHAIKVFHEEGYKKLDLLGIDIERIGRFKRGWGGETVQHYVCTKKSKIWKILKRVGGSIGGIK